jgi:peptidoglycan/LPS O-acetylase OafA/YrhL
MSNSGSPKAHVGVIDGLRGVAILAVLWFHFHQLTGLPAHFDIGNTRIDFSFLEGSGYLGVELFFFISGFVLFYPYAKFVFEGAVKPSVREFVYRRFIKIIPSYYLSLILVVAFAPILFFPSHINLHSIITHFIFTHNFYTSDVTGINSVYWSLAIEVQFYLVFPLLCLAFVRWPFITALGMAGIAYAYRSWSTACCLTDHAFARYQVPTYLDFFAVGMLCSYLYVKARAQKPAWSQRPEWATICVFITATLMVLLMRNVLAPLGPTWGIGAGNRPEELSYLAFLIFAFTLSSLLAAEWWRKFLSNQIFVFFATISYNLYLYHLILASSLLGRLHFPPASTANPLDDPHWQIVFCLFGVAVVVAVATAVTYLFERPLLRIEPRFLEHEKVILEPLEPPNLTAGSVAEVQNPPQGIES